MTRMGKVKTEGRSPRTERNPKTERAKERGQRAVAGGRWGEGRGAASEGWPREGTEDTKGLINSQHSTAKGKAEN